MYEMLLTDIFGYNVYGMMKYNNEDGNRKEGEQTPKKTEK